MWLAFRVLADAGGGGAPMDRGALSDGSGADVPELMVLPPGGVGGAGLAPQCAEHGGMTMDGAQPPPDDAGTPHPAAGPTRQALTHGSGGDVPELVVLR